MQIGCFLLHLIMYLASNVLVVSWVFRDDISGHDNVLRTYPGHVLKSQIYVLKSADIDLFETEDMTLVFLV